MGLSFMSLLRGLLFLICLLCPIYDKDVLYADMKCQSPGHRFHPSLLDTERWSICVKDKVIALANGIIKISNLWEHFGAAMYTPQHVTKDYLGSGITQKTKNAVLGLV